MKQTGTNRELSPNEKLFLAGQLKKFENAVLMTRRREAIQLLVSVGLSDRTAEQTVEEIFAAPEKYGYCQGGCLPKERSARESVKVFSTPPPTEKSLDGSTVDRNRGCDPL